MTAISDTPDRTLEQRRAALEIGNAIRAKRAAFKRDLKAGRAELAPMLVDPPEWLHTAKVGDMLAAIPSVGPVKTSRILRVNQISPSKTVRGLSDRQRAALVVALAGRPRKMLRASRPSLGTAPDAQHMQALSNANVIRLAQADLKRRLFARETTVAETLQWMPDAARSMTVFDLLASQWRWGRWRSRRMLAHLGLPESKLAGTLTPRQITVISDTLAAVEAH